MEVLHVNERLVIIPTYNEKENIQDIIAHVLGLNPVSMYSWSTMGRQMVPQPS